MISFAGGRGARVLAAAVLIHSAVAARGAEIEIINFDGPGEGLNDPAPRLPVGGNAGDTLGEQRLNAVTFAAQLLGARIASTETIRFGISFDALDCAPNSADLGAGGPASLVVGFPGALRLSTFYPIALANALAGRDLEPQRVDVSASFSSALDAPAQADCLNGANWYYGLDDARPPGMLNFISTAVHEFIHGLGFVSFVTLQDDPATAENEAGRFLADGMGNRFPDIYSVFIRDLTLGQNWPSMMPAERAESATNDGNLVWDGPITSGQGAPTLSDGTNGASRVQLYAPDPLLLGSSVSHWDTEVTPDDLMEPFDTGSNNVTQGIGLAACLLLDLGWRLMNNTRCPDGTNLNDEPGPSPVADSGGGGGSGCSGGSGDDDGAVVAGVDPVLPLLLLLAAFGAGRQRRYSGEPPRMATANRRARWRGRRPTR